MVFGPPHASSTAYHPRTSYAPRHERQSDSYTTQPSAKDGHVQDAIDRAMSILTRVDDSLEQFAKENHGELPKRSVVLLGKSGVGKTTLVNALAGAELEVCYDPKTGRVTVRARPEVPGFEIGTRLVSQTSIPRVCACMDRANNEKISVFDFPGLEDNRGTAQEISNALCMQRILASSPNAKVLILIDDSAFTDPKAQVIMSFMSILEDMFSESIDSIGDSVSLVVTHADPLRSPEQIRNNIDLIIDQLDVRGIRRRLLEILSHKIAMFRTPIRNTDKVLSTAETVREVFKNVRGSQYAHNISVKICLSETSKHEALTIHNALVGCVSEKVGGLAETLVERVKDCVQKYIERAALQDEQDAVRGDLSSLLDKLSVIGQSGWDLDQFPAVIEKSSDVAHLCGEDLPKDEVDDVVQKVELLRALSQFVDEKDLMPFNAASSIQGKIAEARATIEAAQSKIATMEAESSAKEARLKVQDVEKALRQEKKRSRRRREDMLLRVGEKMADVLVKVIENRSGKESNSTSERKTESSEEPSADISTSHSGDDAKSESSTSHSFVSDSGKRTRPQNNEKKR